MAPKKQALPSTRSTLMADHAIAFAEYAAEALDVAQQLGIRSQAIKGLGATCFTAMARKMKTRPPQQFTEVARLLQAIAAALFQAEPTDQLRMVAVANKLMNALQATMLVAEGR
jgi:hypothetical protein